MKESLRRRYPFFCERVEYIRKKCCSQGGNSIPYGHKGKRGEVDVDFHGRFALMSRVGEDHWKHVAEFEGLPSGRTIQRWWKEHEAEMSLG
jgi:hypothetical protein